jgi:hypothetical protein
MSTGANFEEITLHLAAACATLQRIVNRALCPGGSMHSNKLKITLLSFFVLLIAVSFTGCYTQLSKERDYGYSGDEESQVEEPAVTTYDDEDYAYDEPDTIIVHNSSSRDVYVQDWVPTVYIDAWWYQPYWHYRSTSWWRWHHAWDPWYGYDNFWGDPWYWPSFSYYGGWAYYDPWFGYGGYYGSPHYYNNHHGGWGWNDYYDGDGRGGRDRNWERRPFGFGNYPGGGRSGMTPNSAQGDTPPNVRPTNGREVAPRSTDAATRSRSTNGTDDWYNGETRREPVRRGSENGTVTRPTTGREQNTQTGETRRKTTTRDANGTTDTNRRETPARESSPEMRRTTEPGASQPNVKRTPTRPQVTPQVDRKKDDQKSTTKKQSETRKRETPRQVKNSESRRSSASVSQRRSSSSSSSSSSGRSSSRSGSSYSGSSGGHSSPPARSSGSSSSGGSSSARSGSSSSSSSSGGSHRR